MIGPRPSGELVGLTAVFACALCCFFYPVVFSNKMFLPLSGGSVPEVMGAATPWQFPGGPRPDNYLIDLGASAWQIEPRARHIASAYAAGEFPLWNPHQGFGAPLATNAQAGAFDLLRLPVLLSASPVAWDAYFPARTVLGLAARYVTECILVFVVNSSKRNPGLAARFRI